MDENGIFLGGWSFQNDEFWGFWWWKSIEKMECCGYRSALKWERMTPNCGESENEQNNYEIFGCIKLAKQHTPTWNIMDPQIFLGSGRSLFHAGFKLDIGDGEGRSHWGSLNAFHSWPMPKKKKNETGVLPHNQFLSKTPAICDWWNIYNIIIYIYSIYIIIYIYIYILCVCVLNIVTVNKKGSLLNTPQKGAP